MSILTDIEIGITQADKTMKRILMDKYNSLEHYFAGCRAAWSYKENCPYLLIEGGVWLGMSLKRNLKYYENEFNDKENHIITIPDWIRFRLPASYTNYYKKTGKKTIIQLTVGSYFNNYDVQFEDGSLIKEYDNVIIKIHYYDSDNDYQYIDASC